MAKRVRRTPDEARALILEATRELIVEVGPDRLRLVAIAKRAGVSHSLISHYFGSIDNLLETVLTNNIENRRQQMIDMLPDIANDGLEGFLKRFFELSSNPLDTKLMVWSVLSGRVSAEDFGPAALGSGKQFADVLQQHLRNRTGEEMPRGPLESVMLLTMCAGIGYALAGDAFWRGMARERNEKLDRDFRQTLARMIENELGVGDS